MTNTPRSRRSTRSAGPICDRAIKLDGEIALLIEVKAIGIELKDNHVKQAVDYAANQGVDWVVLTNGVCWRTYKISFAKPIDFELVLEFHFGDLNPKSEAHLELLWLLAKEGWQKARLGDYHSQRQALSRFSLAALILSDPILEVIRRELRRMSPGIRIEVEQIDEVLRTEGLKREVLEGEKADSARKLVSRAANRTLRHRSRSRPTLRSRKSCRRRPLGALNPPLNTGRHLRAQRLHDLAEHTHT